MRKFDLSQLIENRKPQVVGTIHTPGGLRAGAKLAPGTVDFLEIRMDAFADREREVLAVLQDLRIPLIITARDPREGGIGSLPLARRRELLLACIKSATLLDIELRNFPKMIEVIDAAHSAGVGVIASSHDFKSMPSPKRLKALYSSARWSGADIFKVAAMAEAPVHFATLLDFVAGCNRIPVAAMGMGRFGKVSRLALASAGSVLNYGFLEKSAASGQWPAPLLKERIAEL